MKISIIIVNYNTEDFLEKCLNSIKEKLHDFLFEVIIVDNNSPNDLIKKFPFLFPEFSFYFLKCNHGFGAGCNFGASKASGKYLLFLNPDVRILDNSILSLIEFMDKNSGVGACSGLMLDENENISYCFNSFPDIFWHFKQATGIGLMKNIENLISRDEIKENKIFETDWFHGAFVLINKNIFDRIKGFDENIFLYYEDTDIQKRIKMEGFKIYCLPYVRLKHFTEASVRTEGGSKTYYHHINMGNLYYINKYFNFFEKIIVRLLYILGISAKILLYSFRTKFKNDKFYIKNHLIALSVYLTKFNVKKTL